jgi:hypothetical protein
MHHRQINATCNDLPRQHVRASSRACNKFLRKSLPNDSVHAIVTPGGTTGRSSLQSDMSIQ